MSPHVKTANSTIPPLCSAIGNRYGLPTFSARKLHTKRRRLRGRKGGMTSDPQPSSGGKTKKGEKKQSRKSKKKNIISKLRRSKQRSR